MSIYDKEDSEVLAMPYKNHGPGGELPTYQIGAGKPAPTQKSIEPNAPPAKHRRGEAEIIKALAIKTVPYAAMSGIIFWWQQSGQLAETTGFWALIVLALLGGISIGKCTLGG